jgi:hypothetical protein
MTAAAVAFVVSVACSVDDWAGSAGPVRNFPGSQLPKIHGYAENISLVKTFFI